MTHVSYYFATTIDLFSTHTYVADARLPMWQALACADSNRWPPPVQNFTAACRLFSMVLRYGLFFKKGVHALAIGALAQCPVHGSLVTTVTLKNSRLILLKDTLEDASVTMHKLGAHPCPWN